MDRAILEDRRIWIGGGLVVAIVIAAASWFMFISPKLDSTDALQQQDADAQTANSLVAAKNAKLARESRNLGSLKAQLEQAVAGLPADTGFADFTVEVTNAAATRHVNLSSIAITPATSQAAAPVAAPSTDTTGGGDSGSGSTPAAAPTTATPAADAGTVSINATLTSSGQLSAQTAFLHDLQTGKRRMLVTSSQVSLSADSKVSSVDGATTMTTQVTFFSSPATATQLSGLKATLAGK